MCKVPVACDLIQLWTFCLVENFSQAQVIAKAFFYLCIPAFSIWHHSGGECDWLPGRVDILQEDSTKSIGQGIGWNFKVRIDIEQSKAVGFISSDLTLANASSYASPHMHPFFLPSSSQSGCINSSRLLVRFSFLWDIWLVADMVSINRFFKRILCKHTTSCVRCLELTCGGCLTLILL